MTVDFMTKGLNDTEFTEIWDKTMEFVQLNSADQAQLHSQSHMMCSISHDNKTTETWNWQEFDIK